MKYLIHFLIVFFILSCSSDVNQSIAKNKNTISLSYGKYYPEHERPEFLFHGVSNFIIDEVELILCLLEIRENAVVNNYSLSILSSEYDSLVGTEESRFKLLRSAEIGQHLVAKNTTMFDYLERNHLTEYLIDYNFSDSTHLNYHGGEGYLPLPKNQIADYNLKADKINTPVMESEPNDLLYALKHFPTYYRYSIYTSEHFKTAALFGEIVLKIQDKDERGLSLGRYAQYKYGHDILFDENCISFNGATNIDEYVFPGIIFSNEVVEAYIIDDFKKRGYTNKIKRIYKKVMIGDKPIVSCYDQDGRALFQVVEKDGILKYQEFKHANGSLDPVAEISPILSGLKKFNTSVSKL